MHWNPGTGRGVRLGAALLSVAVLILLTAGPLLAEDGDITLEGGLQPREVNLLSPIKNLLSGRAWLIASGLDPVLLRDKPGFDPVTGLAWGDVGFSGGNSGPQAPSSQGAGVLVPFREPAPAFSRNILITRDFSSFTFQTEPHLAVDPDDPEHLVLGTIDYNFPAVTSYVSIDGGATWEGPFQTKSLRDDLGSGGDPVVAFDREGNTHFAYISIGLEEFSVGPLIAVAAVSSIAVASSEDGGFTWAEPVSSARSGLTSNTTLDLAGRVRGEVELTFLDKPWMAIGPHPTKSGQDVIYVTYTEFQQRSEIFYAGELPFLGVPILETSIKLVHSEDGGLSWSTPISVSPTVQRLFGLEGPKQVVQGSQPAVAPDGTVYVTWMDTTDDDSQEGLAEIYVTSSEDGGQTFSTPIRAADFDEIGFRPRTAFFRFWGSAFPQIAVGPEEEVYIVYTGRPRDKKFDDGDIYLVRSLDQGQKWERPVRLNQDETDRVQFFPAVAVNPQGDVHVMWGDMRDDPAETSYHIYYTRSEDQGETFGFELEELGIRTGDTRVSDFPSNPNRGFPRGLFIGDYFSIKATEDDVYMVWADTRLGEFGPLNQKIAFTRQRAIQSPQLFINPPAGSGGEDIVIQGFNFQPDMNVFVQVGGVTVATARTNAEGRLTSKIFVPVSGEGAHAVQVFDESGNFATGTFFTEFGFDTIRDTQEDVIQQLEALRSGVPLETQADLSALEAEIQSLSQLLEQQTGNGGGVEAWVVALIAVATAIAAIAVTVLATTWRLGAQGRGGAES